LRLVAQSPFDSHLALQVRFRALCIYDRNRRHAHDLLDFVRCADKSPTNAFAAPSGCRQAPCSRRPAATHLPRISIIGSS
jgi:hypothetical protein